MDVKEKLVELLREVQYLGGLEEKIADHLIANGVTVQEKKRFLLKENGEIIPLDQEWISVKDRLPETEDVFLCWSKDLADMMFCYTSDFKQLECTHWMPLPQPPKGE